MGTQEHVCIQCAVFIYRKSNADSPCDTEPPCDTGSPCGAELIEDRTVKCLLREQDITLEVKLSKLAGILEKLNVIKLL